MKDIIAFPLNIECSRAVEKHYIGTDGNVYAKGVGPACLVNPDREGIYRLQAGRKIVAHKLHELQTMLPSGMVNAADTWVIPVKLGDHETFLVTLNTKSVQSSFQAHQITRVAGMDAVLIDTFMQNEDLVHLRQDVLAISKSLEAGIEVLSVYTSEELKASKKLDNARANYWVTAQGSVEVFELSKVYPERVVGVRAASFEMGSSTYTSQAIKGWRERHHTGHCKAGTLANYVAGSATKEDYSRSKNKSTKTKTSSKAKAGSRAKSHSKSARRVNRNRRNRVAEDASITIAKAVVAGQSLKASQTAIEATRAMDHVVTPEQPVKAPTVAQSLSERLSALQQMKSQMKRDLELLEQIETEQEEMEQLMRALNEKRAKVLGGVQ